MCGSSDALLILLKCAMTKCAQRASSTSSKASGASAATCQYIKIFVVCASVCACVTDVSVAVTNLLIIKF